MGSCLLVYRCYLLLFALRFFQFSVISAPMRAISIHPLLNNSDRLRDFLCKGTINKGNVGRFSRTCIVLTVLFLRLSRYRSTLIHLFAPRGRLLCPVFRTVLLLGRVLNVATNFVRDIRTSSARTESYPMSWFPTFNANGVSLPSAGPIFRGIVPLIFYGPCRIPAFAYPFSGVHGQAHRQSRRQGDAPPIDGCQTYQATVPTVPPHRHYSADLLLYPP